MWGIGTPSLRRAEEIETNRRYRNILNNLEEPTMKKTTKKAAPQKESDTDRAYTILAGVLAPQWRVDGKYIPGLYLVMGHEGKGISAHYTVVNAGPGNVAGFFVDRDGDMVKPFTISAAYGPIPESK